MGVAGPLLLPPLPLVAVLNESPFSGFHCYLSLIGQLNNDREINWVDDNVHI